jgi:transmembrane sensor
MVEKKLDIEKADHYFKGKDSDKDSTYINEVFCNKNSEEELNKLLLKQFDELSIEDEIYEKNLEHILYRIHYYINTKISPQKTLLFENILKWSFRFAAVIILPLVILIGIQTYNEVNLKRQTWVEIKAPKWTRVQFSLPDGTIGWLSSNSSLKYNGNFNSDRKVSLSGEAFFDVSKYENRPFVVNTNEIIVKVLGTRFNIASYADEKNVEVVLLEGKLIFNDKEMTNSYTMNPNDMVVFDKTLKSFSTCVVQPQKYSSWIEGKLVFRNDPLNVIAKRLERWYNIDVEVNVSLSEDLRLRATFTDENIEEVLDLLKHSLPIDYKIENGNLKPDSNYAKKKVILIPRPR